MDEIYKLVRGFVEGNVAPDYFIEKLQSDPQVCEWLQSVVPEGKTCYTSREVLQWGIYERVSVEIPYDAHMVLHNFLDGLKYNKWGEYLNIHSEISELLCEAFPQANIQISNKIEERFLFSLTAVPEYLGGREVDSVIDDIIDGLPEGISKTQKTKLCKEQLRQAFCLDGKRYPRWIQSADWPISPSGKPMRFVEQKRKKGKGYETILYTLYVFEDVDTGEQRIVEQFT